MAPPSILYIHVEEPSMAEAAEVLATKLLEDRDVYFEVIDHQSKQRLLKNIGSRLRGYAHRLAHENIRVLVLVDRDDDNCRDLKKTLEDIAHASGLTTKTNPRKDGHFIVVNRIVVEELEAWFFGDVPALRVAYPRVSQNLASNAKYRDPDKIKGGTWEALLRVLQNANYYKGQKHLPKIEVARNVAAAMEPDINQSGSFKAFVEGLHALTA